MQGGLWDGVPGTRQDPLGDRDGQSLRDIERDDGAARGELAHPGGLDPAQGPGGTGGRGGGNEQLAGALHVEAEELGVAQEEGALEPKTNGLGLTESDAGGRFDETGELRRGREHDALAHGCVRGSGTAFDEAQARD